MKRGRRDASLRYEFNRKFAPDFAAIYDRKLGGTALLARSDAEGPRGWTIRTGVRTWFQ